MQNKKKLLPEIYNFLRPKHTKNLVRFGVNKITILYDVMIMFSYLSILIFLFRQGIYNELGILLLFLSMPIAIKLIIDIHKTSGKELNVILYRTAILIRTFSILLILGILI